MENDKEIEITEVPLVEEPIPQVAAPTHQIIREAEALLENSERSLTTLSQYGSGQVEVVEQDTPVAVPPPAQNGSLKGSHFHKFAGVTEMLRDQQTVNLYEVKKLNLAAIVETLERSVHAHEAFPSSDAGMSVSMLAEQASKLIKDLEKSIDPNALCHKILEEVMQPLTQEMVNSLAQEMKWLKNNTNGLVREESRKAFDDTLKSAVTRMGPAFEESLKLAQTRLKKVLNIKEKK
jgi:cellobiose-specific phosphotransferase system component IIB